MNRHTRYKVFIMGIALMLMLMPGASTAFFDDMLCGSYRSSTPRELTECQKLAEQARDNSWWQKVNGQEPWFPRLAISNRTCDERDPKSGRSVLSFVFQLKNESVLRHCAERCDPTKLEACDIFRDVEHKVPYKKAFSRGTKEKPHENTPLHRAAYHLSSKWIDRMIELGMPVDIRNADNRTPLQYVVYKAARYFSRATYYGGCDKLDRYKDTIERLIFHGAAPIDMSYDHQGVSKKKSFFDDMGEYGLPLALFKLIAPYTVTHIIADPECTSLAEQSWRYIKQWGLEYHDVVLESGLPCVGDDLAQHVAQKKPSVAMIKRYIQRGLSLNQTREKKSFLSSYITSHKDGCGVGVLRELVALGVSLHDGYALRGAVESDQPEVVGALLSLGAHTTIPLVNKQTQMSFYEWFSAYKEQSKKSESSYSFGPAIESFIEAAHHGDSFLNNWHELDKRYEGNRAVHVAYRQEKRLAKERKKEWYARLEQQLCAVPMPDQCDQQRVESLRQIIMQSSCEKEAERSECLQKGYDLITSLQDYRWLYYENRCDSPLTCAAKDSLPLLVCMLEKIPAGDEGLAHCAEKIIGNIRVNEAEKGEQECMAAASKLISALPKSWYPSLGLWKRLCWFKNALRNIIFENYDIKTLYGRCGQSLLEYCVSNCFALTSLALVCKAGANPNDVSVNGKPGDYGTPLLHAVMNQRCKIKDIKVMLAYGANPNMRNGWGESPRSCAQKMVRYATGPDMQERARAIVQLFDKHSLRFKPAAVC